MRGFEQDATRRVTKDGMEHIEYVPTQIVAEYFRHVFKQPDDTRLDGILYRSSVSHDGVCVALFCTNEDCTDDPAAAGKKLALVGVHREKSWTPISDEDIAKEIEKAMKAGLV